MYIHSISNRSPANRSALAPDKQKAIRLCMRDVIHDLSSSLYIGQMVWPPFHSLSTSFPRAHAALARVSAGSHPYPQSGISLTESMSIHARVHIAEPNCRHPVPDRTEPCRTMSPIPTMPTAIMRRVSCPSQPQAVLTQCMQVSASYSSTSMPSFAPPFDADTTPVS